MSLMRFSTIGAHSFVPYSYNIFKTLCMYSFFFCSSEFFRIFRSCFDKMQAIHLEFAIIKILLFYKMYSQHLFALAFVADFPPAALEFHQRTPQNSGTTDKKFSHKIKHKKMLHYLLDCI